jgi:aminopeptidase N
VRGHRDSTATTADFERLASAIAGRDLRGFFKAWLYGTKTPQMPGHPDWKQIPPSKTAEKSEKSDRTRWMTPGAMKK